MLSVLNYITWNVSPFIYEGEHFAIGWYGTLWTLGLVGLLVTLIVTFKHDKVPTQYALITFMISLVCIIFFGHLFQGLFYEWYYSPDDPGYYLGIDWNYRNYYFDHPYKFFDFAHGGFASHGIVLGAMFAGWMLSYIFQCKSWWMIDRILMGLTNVGWLVRLGNLFNSEIYGVSTSLPWGILFPGDVTPSHPTQIYEMLIFLGANILCWALYLKFDGGKYLGLISSAGLLFIMTLRFLVEFIKLPQMPIEIDWFLNMGQWLSLPYIIWMSLTLYKAIIVGKCSDTSPQNIG